MTWDVFICHASEDKADFVRPLALALREAGLSVWYDEFSLRIGDSLRKSIEEGLLGSRFGVVVLSPSFFEKEWSQKELSALVTKEVDTGKVILPVWHNVNLEDVRARSILLADRKAVSSVEGPKKVAEIIAAVINEVSHAINQTNSRRPDGLNVVEIDLYRESRTLGKANPFDVHLDGAVIGTLVNGGALSFRTSVGFHELIIAYNLTHVSFPGPMGNAGGNRPAKGKSEPIRQSFLKGKWSFECGYVTGFKASWQEPSPLFLRLRSFAPPQLET